MRKNKVGVQQREFSILALDDDAIMTVTLQAYFRSSGYHVDIENDPNRAIERVREGSYDILLLDFLMSPICGDEVVAQIRKFNRDIFIILLTGHKSLAPPIKTIRELDIQGYYEKSDRFDQLELLVESCVKSIRHLRTISRYRDGLNRILEAMPEIYRLQPPEQLLNQILEQAMGLCGAMHGWIGMQEIGEEASPHKIMYRAKGRYDGDGSLPEKLASKMAEWQKMGWPDHAMVEQNHIVAPLYNEKQGIEGILCVDTEKVIQDDVVQLMDLYAKQAGAALSNASLHRVVQQKNEELEQTYDKLHQRYLEIISAMRRMVDARDIYTRGHSDRVAHYAMLLAKALGKSEEVCEKVRIAGLFHDIGKIGTADDILFKNTSLTKSEYETVKLHTVRGAEILSGISVFEEIVPIVRSHHERIDGKGYPDGLKGEEIPEEARIIAVVDAFDAMTSHRIYRTNLDVPEAIEQLEEGKGTQFDARIVDAFEQVLQNFDQIQKELEWTFAVPER